MVHWTRQIKEVLASQDAIETSENSGPLEEIAFWHNRCVDLSGISEQLRKEGVLRIQMILELSKSSYVASFRKLSKQIQVTLNRFIPRSFVRIVGKEAMNFLLHVLFKMPL